MNAENIKKNNSGVRKFMGTYGGLLLVTVLLAVVISVFNPVFMTSSNLLQLVINNNSVFLASIGMTFVIIGGGIDLSQGALAAFSTMVAALLALAGVNSVFTVLLTVAIGVGVGIVNGVIVSVGKVHAFIVTLGMTTILRGFAVALYGGYPVPIDFNNDFIQFGNGTILGVPNVIIICVIVFIASFLLLTKTNTGRNIYAVGGNPEAARFSGISVVKTSIFSYAYCAGLTALAGVLMASRMYSGVPNAATGLETSAITAVIIGGTSFTGGDGNVIGTLIGVALLGILVNGMVLFGLSEWIQNVVSGVIIIFAVIYDRMRRTKNA